MCLRRVLYRCRRFIAHCVVHGMVEYVLLGSSTVTFGISCGLFSLCYSNWKVHGGWHMARPRVITDLIFHCGQRPLRAYEGKSSEPIPPDPRSRESVHKVTFAVHNIFTPVPVAAYGVFQVHS